MESEAIEEADPSRRESSLQLTPKRRIPDNFLDVSPDQQSSPQVDLCMEAKPHSFHIHKTVPKAVKPDVNSHIKVQNLPPHIQSNRSLVQLPSSLSYDHHADLNNDQPLDLREVRQKQSKFDINQYHEGENDGQKNSNLHQENISDVNGSEKMKVSFETNSVPLEQNGFDSEMCNGNAVSCNSLMETSVDGADVQDGSTDCDDIRDVNALNGQQNESSCERKIKAENEPFNCKNGAEEIISQDIKTERLFNETSAKEDVSLNSARGLSCQVNDIKSKDLALTETMPVVKRKRGRPRKLKDTDSAISTPTPVKRVRAIRRCTREESKTEENCNKNKNHICIGCSSAFQWETELYEHELDCPDASAPRSKTRELSYTCPLCNIDCTRKHGLKRHLVRKHPSVESFPCTFCHMQVGPMQEYLHHLHGHLKSIASLRKIKPAPKRVPNKSKPPNDTAHLPESEFICIQCNKSVKNDHSLVLHMLGHKINETLKLTVKDSQSKDKTLSDFSSAELPSQDNIRHLLESELQSSSLILPESFPSVSSDLVSTMNQSFSLVAIMLKRLLSELSWNEATSPKSTDDLIKKLSVLSSVSSGITEISNCLTQLLAKGGGQPSDSVLPQGSDAAEPVIKLEKEEQEENDFELGVQELENGEDDDDDEDYIDEPKAAPKRKVNKRRLSGIKKGKKKIVCNVCGQILSSASNYKRHKMIHEDARPHRCKICSKQFRRNHQLERHYNVHTVAGKFQCSVCDFSVKTISVFLKHMMDKHDKFVEEDCDITAVLMQENGDDMIEGENNDDGSENGMSENNGNESDKGNEDKDDETTQRTSQRKSRSVKVEIADQAPYICSECGIELAHYSSFVRHKMIHQNRKPFQCQVCSKTFRRRHQLTRHGMVHAKRGNKYKCELCDFFTNTRATLEKHIVEHDAERIYNCETCGHKTKTVYELSQHKKTHEPRSCKHCDYNATNLSDLRIHERKTHLTLTCSQCDYACFSNWQLQRHLKTHNKEANELYFCELCGFSCNTKRQFSYHMIRHTNRTPFSCPECDYKCSSRSSLAAHKLMHAGLKPFLCSFCGMTFRRSSHLKNHLLIHKDEKQFVCRTCGHPFRTRHNLKVHEMIHTGEKRHKCHLCPFACRRNKELRLHLEKHAASDVNVTDNESAFIVPKAEMKIEPSTLPQEVFAAMFQVS